MCCGYPDLNPFLQISFFVWTKHIIYIIPIHHKAINSVISVVCIGSLIEHKAYPKRSMMQYNQE